LEKVEDVDWFRVILENEELLFDCLLHALRVASRPFMFDKFQFGIHVADLGGKGDRRSHLHLRRFRSVRIVAVVVVSSSHVDVEEEVKVG
jgi:hypothetical protein